MKLDLMTGLYVFMLAAFIGFEVIRRVSPLLHTPLMSLTNALDAIAVVGPAVVHTGAAGHLARLFEMGYLTVMFGGNAVATHDAESALYGTSLGVRLDTGAIVPGGHEHHLRAINRIRAAGGFENAVKDGVLREGLM